MENKKLVLDYSKWICGGEGPHKLGKGKVALLNNEGYMCCLGQWSLQLGATDSQIINMGEPYEPNLDIPGLTIMMEDEYDYDQIKMIAKNSKFSEDAMLINDGEASTPEAKITALSALCKTHGFELEV